MVMMEGNTQLVSKALAVMGTERGEGAVAALRAARAKHAAAVAKVGVGGHAPTCTSNAAPPRKGPAYGRVSRVREIRMRQ
jgi:hypothetical protein